jgi:hypothetical protein
MGIDQPIIPRAFTSVSAPVYLRDGFSYWMMAMEYARVLPAIKRIGTDYSFFISSNEQLQIDSSLRAEPHPTRRDDYIVQSYDLSFRPGRLTNRNRYEITQQIFNQVGTRRFSGLPRKEFVRNLAGNYIVYNSVDNIVTGGVPTNFGWRGDSTEGYFLTPVKLEEPTDNGEAFQVSGFFDFPQNSIYNILLTYPHWFNVIDAAGLIDRDAGELRFINEAEYHTIFIPTAEALASYPPDSLSLDERREFIKYHFLRGDHIFTDGNMPSGEYPTARIDESSTSFNTVYSKIDVRTGTDFIELRNSEGLIYTITENDSTTNILSGRNTLRPNDPNQNFVTNAVFHTIDSVLLKR